MSIATETEELETFIRGYKAGFRDHPPGARSESAISRDRLAIAISEWARETEALSNITFGDVNRVLDASGFAGRRLAKEEKT